MIMKVMREISISLVIIGLYKCCKRWELFALVENHRKEIEINYQP